MVSSVLALFNLWDFYYYGLRPFDLVGFLFITYYFFSRSNNKSISYNNFGFILILFLITWVYIMVGILNTMDSGLYFGDFHTTSILILNIKSAIGFIMGLIVFTIFYYIKIEKIDLLKYLDFIILIHITSFFSQYFYYLFTGEILNPHYYTENAYGATGLRSHGFGFFRPSGLFVESASYAFTMYMLICLRLSLQKRYNYKIILGFITTALSFSLWGYITFLILLFIFKPKARYIFIFSTLFFVLIIYFYNAFPILKILIFDRVSNFSSDLSFVNRYSTLYETNPDISFYGSLFGRGIMPGGGSALFNLINIFGIIGLTGILIIINLINGKDNNIKFMLILGLLITAASQLLTLFFFWAWLALMIRANQKKQLSMVFG